jgi:hypothetical protein
VVVAEQLQHDVPVDAANPAVNPYDPPNAIVGAVDRAVSAKRFGLISIACGVAAMAAIWSAFGYFMYQENSRSPYFGSDGLAIMAIVAFSVVVSLAGLVTAAAALRMGNRNESVLGLFVNGIVVVVQVYFLLS